LGSVLHGARERIPFHSPDIDTPHSLPYRGKARCRDNAHDMEFSLAKLGKDGSLTQCGPAET
jgi:hypothetical protein